ncbi:MAG: Ribosomal large subunit methyltransferase, partial [Gemmatimonadetes bacterium]|nr:Ribosomal large subunit methyltransferase [Gemmatimonadota bacterium]
MPDLENLLNLTPAHAEDRLAVVMRELGEPSYRVGQVLRRLWIRPAASFDVMTELSATLRAALAERFSIPRL